MAQPPVQTANVQPTAGSITYLEIKLLSNSTPAVPVATSAAAVAGATTLTVTALTGSIAAGAVLHFLNQDVVTTAAAAAAATTLTVLPLTAALASGATASYDGFVSMPLAGTVNLAISPTEASYSAYASSGDNVWDYAVKVASNAKLTWMTAAADSDPNVAPFVQAGLRSGNSALAFFRLRRASGSWYTGVTTVGVTPADPERGIATTNFSGTVTGQITFTPGP